MTAPDKSIRLWRLARHPEGDDFAAAIEFDRAPMPSPGDGEVLIRNHYLSLDAGTRMWMTPRTDSYQPPIPLGNPVPGLVLGQVIESKDAQFKPGDWVRAFGTWADYSCLTPALSAMQLVDASVKDMRQHLGVLGMNAWTAYVGIADVAKTRPGETVLVSAAAGATGMLAAQVAKLMGCTVIGLAGSEDKCAYLTGELKLDGALNYKSTDFASRLAAIPGGINVYFDNVGGEILDLVLPNMAHYGRVAVCGLIATYAAGEAGAGPKRFDQVLMRRLTISGFFSPDFMQRGPEINRIMRHWLDTGRIRMNFDVTQGLENVLPAYKKLFTGGNIGKVLVSLLP